MKKKSVIVLLTMSMVTTLLVGCKSKDNAESGNENEQNQAGQETSDENSSLAGTELNLYTWAGMFPQEGISSARSGR